MKKTIWTLPLLEKNKMTGNIGKDAIESDKIHQLLDDSFYLQCASSCSDIMGKQMKENPDFQCFTFIFDTPKDLLEHLTDRKDIQPRVVNGMSLEAAKDIYTMYGGILGECRKIFKETKDIALFVAIFKDFETAKKNNFSVKNMELKVFSGITLQHRYEEKKDEKSSGKKVVFRNGKLQ